MRVRRRKALLDAMEGEILERIRRASGSAASTTEPGDCDRPPGDDGWIGTAEAASICGRTQAHVARLARANDLASNPDGFARWNGQWLIWPARFRRYRKSGRLGR